MTHHHSPEGAEPDHAWLRERLAADPAPSMPLAVAERIATALAEQQQAREVGDFTPDAMPAELAGIEEPNGLGTFGPNPPVDYSPRALGLPDLVEIGGEEPDEADLDG